MGFVESAAAPARKGAADGVSRFPHHFWWLLRHSFMRAWEDGCLGIAKGAAYSALLSFFPLLTLTATLLVQAHAQSVSRIIARFLFEVVPPGTEELVQRHFAVRGERPVSLLIVASLLSLWAASGVMESLMEGFDAAYHVPCGRPLVRQRLVAILLVISVAVPSLCASLLVLFGNRTERHLMGWLGLATADQQLAGGLALAGGLLRFLIPIVAVTLVTATLYYLGPNRRQRWSGVLPGAMVTTALWLISTQIFAWYVRNIANYNVLYGSIGAVIALLVWMYVLSITALVGCEFNAERERLLRASSVPH
jgi:membrane protein